MKTKNAVQIRGTAGVRFDHHPPVAPTVNRAKEATRNRKSVLWTLWATISLSALFDSCQRTAFRRHVKPTHFPTKSQRRKPTGVNNVQMKHYQRLINYLPIRNVSHTFTADCAAHIRPDNLEQSRGYESSISSCLPLLRSSFRLAHRKRSESR